MEKEVLEERLRWIKSLVEAMNSDNLEDLKEITLTWINRML